MKPTIAIMSPGDMGHAVGAVLRQAGLRVITQLDGRSECTRALAARAGIEEVSDDDALVRAADILLSILVPAEAVALAERIARAVRGTGATPLYVDCNAIAPQTTRQVAEIVEGAGAGFVDAGIIGPPPQSGASSTRFYASGRDAAAFAALQDFGLEVRAVGAEPGQASAVKMCYAALTKGTTALMTELSIAAERLGVSDALRAEFAESQPAMLERMQRAVPAMVPKAHRWVGEMAEIARTFQTCGLTPHTFEGAAELYALVAETDLGRTSPEDWRRQPASFDELVSRLAAEAAGPASMRTAPEPREVSRTALQPGPATSGAKP
jgi:3-hydroxyisobutyrate dehydrogenase-like beta-hydroxyacid dehydrogenase